MPKTPADAVQASDSGLVLREDDRKDSDSSSTAIAVDLPGELPGF